MGDQYDYDVVFSRSARLDSGGSLATAFAQLPVYFGGAGGTCTVAPAGSSASARVGDRVFGQAVRTCPGCEGGLPETGPVRSFTIRPPAVKARLEVPRRLYAGYLGVFTLASVARSARGSLLQRRVGRRWRTVSVGAGYQRDELIAELPAGRQTSGPCSSSERSSSRSPSARHRPAQGGRVVQGFKASVLAFCVGPTLAQSMFVRSYADLSSTRVAPDGSVVGRLKLSSGAQIKLVGRLRGRRFQGAVSLS